MADMPIIKVVLCQGGKKLSIFVMILISFCKGKLYEIVIYVAIKVKDIFRVNVKVGL